jgi:hypothetical protein
MATVTFVGGPRDGDQQEIPDPAPWAIRVAVPLTGAGPWPGDMEPADVTYMRREGDWAGRRYTLYLAPTETMEGWRPTTHRCSACGKPVVVDLIDTTLQGDWAEDRRTACWGRAERCPCGDGRPELVDGWTEQVTWQVTE